MGLHTLYTYRGITELRKIQSEKDVFPFVFAETKKAIERSPEVCIDITALTYYLQTNKNDIQAVQVNFSVMTKGSIVIVDELLAERVLELLPFIFFGHTAYFPPKAEELENSIPPNLQPCKRRQLYKYISNLDLDKIIYFANSNGIPIATFSRVNSELRTEFEQFNKAQKLALIDLTSLSYALEDNKNLIYVLEQLLAIFPNINVIVQAAQVDVLLKYFPLFFEGQELISKLIPELSDIEEVETPLIAKITDLSPDALISFTQKFDHNLIGHQYFKKRLHYAIKNFISLNKAKEQKVLSVFLFGASGIGKTEVARLLANNLQANSYLAKINFQNYSSQDAINSLIGSPAGYVGCNSGELSEKVTKSKVAVLLCDEFEKTTRPVYSFFLELLEEGRFTDSMAREYDMDGYIIVFTSNIPNESEYRKSIPPELQTRFDLVCEFEEARSSEKLDFLDLLLEKAQTKYSEKFSQIEMTKEDKEELYSFDYSGLSALRDIKRVFNNRLMDYFNRKGI